MERCLRYGKLSGYPNPKIKYYIDWILFKISENRILLAAPTEQPHQNK